MSNVIPFCEFFTCVTRIFFFYFVLFLYLMLFESCKTCKIFFFYEWFFFLLLWYINYTLAKHYDAPLNRIWYISVYTSPKHFYASFAFFFECIIHFTHNLYDFFIYTYFAFDIVLEMKKEKYKKWVQMKKTLKFDRWVQFLNNYLNKLICGEKN